MLKEHQSEICVQPILTIAIPTYNRASYLDLCLSRFKEELSKLSVNERKLVKFYISDNASTDNTDEVISRYQLIGSAEFEVIHNSSNIGGESNVLQCYVSATTPYVWVFGDDDLILQGGLSLVLNILLKYDVDMLSVGCKPYIGNLDIKNKFKSKNNFNNFELFNGAIAFAKRTNVNLTFITSLIVRANYFNSELYSKVKNSNLPQMSWVYSLLSKGKRFGILDNKIVLAKANNTGGYGLFQVFGNNLHQITKLFLKDKPELIKIIQNGVIINFFPSFILAFRANQADFKQEIEFPKILKDLYSSNWRYYVFILPLVYLPLFAAKLFNILLKISRRFFMSILV